jgi:TRAP transporter TAXI family solute receptor
MTLAPNVALFITKADSGIKTFADLKGKRVVIGPAGAGFEYFVKPILEAHGVRYEDFTALNASQSAAVDMLTDGSAAAIFIGGAIPTASITQASATMDLHFIPFDEAARTKLSSDYLFFSPAVIPANTYRGQTTEFAGLDVGSMHLITAVTQDEALVYQVTKTLWEQREQVTQKHPAGRAINPKNVIRDTGTPFHAGAIRFYREIGIWPQ